MQFFKLIPLALLPLSLTAPTPTLEARDGAAVADAISVVATDLVGLNNSVTAFHGGLFNIGQALAVQNSSTVLKDALQNAVSATQASQNFTQDESLTVGLALLSLQPQIYSTLDNLDSKKKDFDMVADIISLRKTVLQTLQTQKSLSATLGDEITERLVPALQGLAPPVNQGIQDKFSDAIAVYSVKGSGIPLPPIPGKEKN